MQQTQMPARTELKSLVRKKPEESHASVLVSENTEFFEEGRRVGLYLKNQRLESLREAVLSVGRFPVFLRTSGLPHASLTFGGQPRVPVRMRDYCSRASAEKKHPELYREVISAAGYASELLKQYFPDRHEKSLEAMASVKNQWVIPGSVFTSAIINQSNPLLYHRDSGNFKDTWAVMFTLRRRVLGGRLALPERGVKFACEDSSVAVFDNQNELHGVTPMSMEDDDSYRYTLVFYSMARLCSCLSPKEELKRAIVRRTAVERKRAGLAKS